ncbi:DUF4132 domain-containing protein [Glycomyces sp. YM15]|uniref:DUF4132 domain-containing protein n=1 Tax=Glycomyces sp. YM15 TaxID=2800446 RepID=UPI001965ED6E|nr:DUF4132 domain-containing protein [Glycomyces sp. YM15]
MEHNDPVRLPDSWTAHLLPWRGKRLGPDIDTDATAPTQVAERIAHHRSRIETALRRPENKRWADAALEHLDGSPSPEGAAVVLNVAESGQYSGQIAPDRRNLHLDAWLREHGLPFAAAATVGAMPLQSWFPDYRKIIADKHLGEIEPHHAAWYWFYMRDTIIRVRALLARASGSEYAAAVAAVGAHRTSPVRRIAAALLMPTELDWVAEACADQSAGVGFEWALRSMATTPEHVAAAKRPFIRKDALSEQTVAMLVDAMGVDALPVLGATLTQAEALTAAQRSLVLQAIGLLPGDAAPLFLIDHLRVPGTLNALFAMAALTPERVARAVAQRSRDAAPGLRVKLAGFARTAPGLLEAAAQDLESWHREAIAELVDDSLLVPSAPGEALPPLLVSPPWARKRAKRKEVVIEGLAPSLADRLVWTEEERLRWAGLQEEDISWIQDGFWDNDIARARKHSRFRDATYFFAWAPFDVAEELLDKWDGSAEDPHVIEIERMLGRFGLRVLERLTPHLKRGTSYTPAIMPIQNLEAARLAADRLTRLKSLRPLARQWFVRHSAAAAHLLVPDALGSDKTLRRNAANALRHLIAVHGASVVVDAAKEYGDEAVAAIGALIDADPLDPGEIKIPKAPVWADPAMLPQVLLKDRETALPAESVRHLTTVLSLASPDSPYAGIDVVAETCDRDSLAAFSWALFELWIAADAPSKDGWALTQLTHFGGDDAVRELTPMVRAWPGQSQHKRAVAGLEVLGAIGTEAALRAIHGISEKVKFKALKEKATELIQMIAADLGLTTDQLGDRLVPDFGLGGPSEEGGSALVLDYGPRQFKVGLDEQLKPFVTDMDGKPRKDLPKPGASDDAELAEAARKRFSQLKKDLRTVAKDQIGRLERAMIAGRSWTAAEFRAFFVDHPLTSHLARRLIWLAETDGTQAAFRIAEDKSLTDVEEEDFTLPEDATVSLIHPARLGTDLSVWGQILADYEILQPFDQLGRPVMAFTEEELATGRLTRFVGATVESVRLLGMTHWGWQRAAPEDGGCEPGLCFPLPGGGFVVLSLDPGIYAGNPAELPEQHVVGVCLSHIEDYSAYERQGRSHPTEIDPVSASEILIGLARITQTS